MNEKIWLSSPHMGGHELKYIQEAFEGNWIAPLGPNVNNFENDLEAFLNRNIHAAALNSGTSAIHLALVLLGVKPSDEVICQSMTFSASANPVLYQHATPVFVDSEASSWNISPILLETAIKDRIAEGKKPKAIIVVHLYGMPAQMDAVISVARRYEIPVIEDAAEGLGSSYNGQFVGTFGDIAVLSFNGNKIITTSGGGALLSPNKQFVEKARFLATQARDKAPHYQHSEIGYNYRMSNICAGIGRGQMEVLKERIDQRRRNFFYYKSGLADVSCLTFQDEPDDRFFSNHWLTAVLFRDYNERERVRQKLESLNIESRPLWKPMHMQPVFNDKPAYVDGTSEKFFERGLCLPSGSNLSENDLNTVIASIHDVI